MTHHTCPQCGYDLHLLRSGRCPECGQPIDGNAAHRWPPEAIAGIWSVAILLGSQLLSIVIQHLVWPAASGPRAREWIVHDGNVQKVPEYIPLTVWLPMTLTVAGFLAVTTWLSRRLERDGRPATASTIIYAIISIGVLWVSYGCLKWTSLCCD